jgi:cytoskeletal protein RodZ
MKQKLQNNDAGFAIIEALLIAVIIGAIAGVGMYVMKQKNAATATINSATTGTSNSTALSTSASPKPATTATSTTSSISALTQQDAITEKAVDNSTDAATQTNTTSANSAISNVGGAYNATNL